MTEGRIRGVEDFQEFFAAFNRRDYDSVLGYLSPGCVWDASEKRLEGREAIREYWTGWHSAIRETLTEPGDIVFGGNTAYLQTTAVLEFTGDGTFFGRPYPKGSRVELPCVDVYTLDGEGAILECRVYTKFRPA